MKSEAYDLEERLLEYSVRIIRLAESVVSTTAGRHVAEQVLRSGTAALPNHGEAQAAESKRDFVHKMTLGLKELRETLRWLQLIQRVPLMKSPERIEPLLRETDELIRIFVSSIRTARRPAEIPPPVRGSAFEVQGSKFAKR
jgi:four helix bundle protein